MELVALFLLLVALFLFVAYLIRTRGRDEVCVSVSSGDSRIEIRAASVSDADRLLQSIVTRRSSLFPPT
jgi:hypothetical protein